MAYCFMHMSFKYRKDKEKVPSSSRLCSFQEKRKGSRARFCSSVMVYSFRKDLNIICGDHSIRYISVLSLCCITETNIIGFIDYNEIINLKKI